MDDTRGKEVVGLFEMSSIRPVSGVQFRQAPGRTGWFYLPGALEGGSKCHTWILYIKNNPYF